MAGRAKENLPGGSLKYLFVCLKVRIFKRSYRSYNYNVPSINDYEWSQHFVVSIADSFHCNYD